jgi:hypothetical protein
VTYKAVGANYYDQADELLSRLPKEVEVQARLGGVECLEVRRPDGHPATFHLTVVGKVYDLGEKGNWLRASRSLARLLNLSWERGGYSWTKMRWVRS